MIQKARELVVFSVTWFLLAIVQTNGADPTKAKDWIDQLRHPVPSVRIQAAARLAELGKLGELAESALEPLSKCMLDSQADVRLYASYALGRIQADTERSLVLLIPLLADSNEHVRYSSEWSISEIARSISVRDITDKDVRNLSTVFESADRALARSAVQEQHVLAVQLALARLKNHGTQSVEPKQPNASVDNLVVSLSASTLRLMPKTAIRQINWFMNVLYHRYDRACTPEPVKIS